MSERVMPWPEVVKALLRHVVIRWPELVGIECSFKLTPEGMKVVPLEKK